MGRQASAGTCYGYTVRSDLTFRLLREHGATAEELRVEEWHSAQPAIDGPTMQWQRRPDHELEARLYLRDGRYRFWTDVEGWFSIDPRAPRIRVPRSPDPVRREERLWGLPAALCFLARGELPMHAAAVEVGRSALLFAAPGKFGKTTLAAAFLRAGHRALSEDFTCCRVSPVPAVLPGPALLRVRRDVYDHLDLPGTWPVAEDPGRVHLAMDWSLRGNGDPVPLRGVLFLRTADRGCRVEPVPVDEAITNLWALTFKLPHDADRARSFQGIASLASTVPVLNLYRPLRLETLPEVVDEIIATCLEA